MINLGMIGSRPLPAAGAWGPLDEASLLWWLDASDLATITKDGSNQVSAWNNKAVPNFGDLAQGTAIDAPVWSTNGLNNQPCLTLSNDRMLGTFAHIGPDTQLIAAVSISSASNSSGVGISFAPTGIASSADGGWHALRRNTTIEQADMLLNTASRGAQVITYDVPFVWSAALTATSVLSRKDGGATSGSTSLTVTTDFDLAAIGNGIIAAGTANSVRMHGKIGAILAFSSIDATLRQKAEGYLAHRYGITLAAGHPYLSAPP